MMTKEYIKERIRDSRETAKYLGRDLNMDVFNLSPLLQKEGNYESWEYLNMKCCIQRNGMLGWCGYVGVQSDNILFGRDFRDKLEIGDKEGVPIPEKHSVIELFAHMMNGAVNDEGVNLVPITLLISAHGGINWANHIYHIRKNHRNPDKYSFTENGKYFYEKDWWYFGFDCGHHGDLLPLMPYLGFMGGEYRPKEYVIEETNRLAEQLIKYIL